MESHTRGEIIAMTADNFMMNLTHANKADIQRYFAEIKENREFLNHMEKYQRDQPVRRYSGDFGIGPTPGAVLYTICRKLKPAIVIETGVSSGISSSYLLCALEQNKLGQLYSIDLPWWSGYESGWRIPDYLRNRWHLIQGKSVETLVPLLDKVSPIDIFLHDSDHTYENMLREFQTAWQYLKPGGLLLSHNIDTNGAFSDFCKANSVKGYSLANLGGTVREISK